MCLKKWGVHANKTCWVWSQNSGSTTVPSVKIYLILCSFGGLRMPKFVFYWVRLKMWWKLSQMAILMGKTMINQWTFGGFSPKMSDVQLVMGALADEAGNTQGQKAKGTKAAWDFDGLRRMGHVFSWSVCGQPLGLFFDHYMFPLCFFPCFMRFNKLIIFVGWSWNHKKCISMVKKTCMNIYWWLISICVTEWSEPKWNQNGCSMSVLCCGPAKSTIKCRDTCEACWTFAFGDGSTPLK